MLSRRRFLHAVTVTLLAAPLTAEAQPVAMPVVGADKVIELGR